MHAVDSVGPWEQVRGKETDCNTSQRILRRTATFGAATRRPWIRPRVSEQHHSWSKGGRAVG